MVLGFANMLAQVWDTERPRTVFVGFDTIGEPTYRHELLPQYQSGRDFPPELLFQLVSDRTTVLLPRRGVSELERVSPAQVREKYGVDPAQVADFIALRGDSSDKIPGAKGIGPGRAATILREHKTLDAAIQAGVFQEQAEALRLYLRIARLRYEAPVPELPDAQPRFDAAADLVEEWGLQALAKRFRARTTS